MSQPISQTSPSLIAAVGVVERQRALAQALHLAADQHDAALERVEHFVLVPRLAILRDQPLVVVLAIEGRLFSWAWPWSYGLGVRLRRGTMR